MSAFGGRSQPVSATPLVVYRQGLRIRAAVLLCALNKARAQAQPEASGGIFPGLLYFRLCPPHSEIALALVVRGQNFRTIYFVALPSHELDDGIGKLAFDFAS